MIAARQSRLVGWAREEFQPDALVRSFTSAWVIFTLEVILVVSFAALVFNGPLSGYLSLGLTYFLAGNALLTLLVGLFSSYSGSIAVPQDTPAVIMALAVAGLAGALPLQAQGSERFATTLFLILITTTGTGILFLGMGVFRLGGLVRFLPYPVMGGFLAGTGWLLMVASASCSPYPLPQRCFCRTDSFSGCRVSWSVC